MKKLLSILILIIAVAGTATAQCEYYVVSNGSEWEMETYNAKGKLTARNQQKVTQFNATATGFNAMINSIMLNDKGKETMKGDLEMKCENGTLHFDMRNFVSEDQMKAYSSYETKIESKSLETPSKLSIGQTLPDGSITISAVGSPLPMKMTIVITNRKVESQESITTPAGTFACYKITSLMNMQSQMGVNMSFSFTSTEWLAPAVGTVRSETYRNGKLNGYTILTKRKG
ncbi:MAG: hypothetical protein JNM57_15275 [Cyclobacteriaceae bacterium]|nr:hypothetical protein [Cyclobacteriaceae bacterium]